MRPELLEMRRETEGARRPPPGVPRSSPRVRRPVVLVAVAVLCAGGGLAGTDSSSSQVGAGGRADTEAGAHASADRVARSPGDVDSSTDRAGHHHHAAEHAPARPPATRRGRADVADHPAPGVLADKDGTKERLDGKSARFSSLCTHSHSAPDDPIVHFGHPGAAHEHDFLGNTSTNAFSTYESLRATAATTCNRSGDTAAYWVPSLRADGKIVRPSIMRAYYQTGGKANTAIQPFPKGLKAVTEMGKKVEWFCLGGGGVNAAGTTPTCPPGKRLMLRITFPDCWDGRNVDTPDHRSHLAYSSKGGCSVSHPVPVPQLRVALEYPTNGVGGVELASGGPETAHADFFNAWDQPALEHLIRSCINVNGECGSKGP